MSHDEGLPQTGDAQEIGADAVRCLYANAPRSWLLKDLGGTDDYGFDFQIQLKAGQQVREIFRAQLKGTRSPKLSADGEFFSIALSTSTLRYYDNVVEPVLLILCDLSVNLEEPIACPMYYVWLRNELRRVGIAEIPLGQKEVTLRLPKANLLTKGIDLLEDVRQANALANVGHALDVSVADMKPDLGAEQRIAVVKGVERSIAERSAAFVDALAAPPKEFWMEPPRGTLDWHLWIARKHINIGRLDKCQTELTAAANKLAGAKKVVLAEYWHLTGRLANAIGEPERASDAFRKAAEIGDEARCWGAWAESELRRRYHPDTPQDFTDVIAALPGAEPQILSIKVRLLAASGKYDEAMALLKTFDGPESLAARAVVQTMYSQPQEALQACTDGLALPDTPESTRHLFLVLKARARFNLATASVNVRMEDEFVPHSGLPGTDAQLLRQAWEDIQEAITVMEEIGWVSNAEFIVDLWAAAAAMLGKQREILSSLMAAARKRPDVESIQRAAETIAAQCGDFTSALEVNDRLPDGDTKILRRAAFLHELGKHRDCVELIEKRIGEISPEHQLYGNVLILAALSANVLARSDLVQSWAELLTKLPELEQHRAVLDYFLAKESNKLGEDEALRDLERWDQEHGHPISTTLALFQELDPTSNSQAQKLLVVSERLSARSRLSPMVAVQTGMALVTLEKWPELVALCELAEREFKINPRITALKALGLDRGGQTEEAKRVLESMLEGGIADNLALNTYVNIMVRWGYVDEAIEATEKILEGATIRARKIECIRLLFNLIQTADPQNARLVNLAFRMGELADRENEVEEGVFLAMVLVGTNFGDAAMTGQQRADFISRSEQFFSRFPDSKVIRKMEISADSAGDEFLKALKKTIGQTEERERFYIKVERQLQRGELPIPYAWRPKHALRMVHDLAHLWELTKRSGADDKKYHLSMVGAQWTSLPSSELRERVPLLDLITLFVLQDLELLDKLFELFPKIAISQATLEELAKMTQMFSGSFLRDKCLELQSHLKGKLAQILQPRATVESEEARLSLAFEEVRELALTPRFLLYSDDVLFRIWCSRGEDKPQGMCTLDLLQALEDAGLITTFEAARKIALLCSWHVGIHILLKYQRAIVPNSVLQARNVDEGVGLLQQSSDFMSIATGMWDFRSDFVKGLTHVGSVVRQLIDEENLPSVAVASFVGVWYVKAKLRDDAPHPPLSLLSKLFMYVLAHDPPPGEGSARRLWSVFMDLVEFEHKDRMDEAKEREARRLLAAEAADFDTELAERGTDTRVNLRDRLIRGLTPGTEAAEVFTNAYDSARITKEVKAQKR